MKLSVNELTGFLLDYAVSLTLQKDIEFAFDVEQDETHGHRIEQIFPHEGVIKRIGFNPSRSRANGLFVVNTMMRLYWVITYNTPKGVYMAYSDKDFHRDPMSWPRYHGQTLVEAASRCYASCFSGKMIDIPEHYVNAQIALELKQEIQIAKTHKENNVIK
jgi:hypothetical protein